MGPGEVFIALIVIGLPMIDVVYLIFSRWFKLKEKQLRWKPAWPPRRRRNMRLSNAELEARVRVLEQIVTDGGMRNRRPDRGLARPPADRQRRESEMNPFEMVVLIVVDRDDRERAAGQIFAPPPPRRSKATRRRRSKRSAEGRGQAAEGAHPRPRTDRDRQGKTRCRARSRNCATASDISAGALLGAEA